MHAAELSELKRPDGKLKIDLIVQAGTAPLTVQICKRSDGSDWLLGVGGYAKVQPPLYAWMLALVTDTASLKLVATASIAQLRRLQPKGC